VAQAQIIWEAFNLFNRANINGVEQTHYTVPFPALTLTPNASLVARRAAPASASCSWPERSPSDGTRPHPVAPGI
jgi:hypothetical protein